MRRPRRLLKRDRETVRARPTEDHEVVRIDRSAPIAPTAEFDPSRHIVQVPVARFVELDCDHCLRALEARGIRVDRTKGSSAIDLARNIRASDAVVDGFESILFIDSDIMFDPADAIRLLQRPEPVICGLYAAKKLGDGQINCRFADGIRRIKFGDWADRYYPLKRAAGGFLRIKTAAIKQIVKRLELPWCMMAGRWAWPLFQPMVLDEDGETHYLTEDYAFSERCLRAGITPMADTSFRLYHIGDSVFGVEEASGLYVQRSRNIEYVVADPPPNPPGWGIPPSLD